MLDSCEGPEKDMLGTLGHRFVDNLECDCDDHCARCSVTFELHVKFDHGEIPPNSVQKLVTSQDLKPMAMVDGLCIDDVQPVHFSNAVDSESAQDDGILIVKLAQGQELHVIAVAILGIAKRHAKWSPVSACSFTCEPIIDTNTPALDSRSDLERASIRDSCPVGVFGDTSRSLSTDGSHNMTVDPGQGLIVRHRDRCMYCGECEKRCSEITGRVDHDLLTIRRNTSKFVFKVETTGALAPEDVVQQALHVLRTKMRGLQDEVQTQIDDEQLRLQVTVLFLAMSAFLFFNK